MGSSKVAKKTILTIFELLMVNYKQNGMMFYYDGDKTLPVWKAENSCLNWIELKSFFKIWIESFGIKNVKINILYTIYYSI